MSNDMSNLMNQINNMIKNNQIPDEIKNIMNGLNNTNEQTQSNESTSNSEFDMETIIKIKKVMDSIKESSNDPRANLLRSLKPYLKDSRKEKIDQYIQLFGMSKAFEMFGSSLGGDKKQ